MHVVFTNVKSKFVSNDATLLRIRHRVVDLPKKGHHCTEVAIAYLSHQNLFHKTPKPTEFLPGKLDEFFFKLRFSTFTLKKENHLNQRFIFWFPCKFQGCFLPLKMILDYPDHLVGP